MKVSIDNHDIQTKTALGEKVIVCDDCGNLYEIIPYIKPKDDEDTSK